MADCKKKKIQTLQLFSLGPLRSRENEITLHNVQKFCKLTKPRKMSFFFSLLIIAANDFFVFFACDDISFPRVLLTLFPNRLLFDGWIFGLPFHTKFWLVLLSIDCTRSTVQSIDPDLLLLLYPPLQLK